MKCKFGNSKVSGLCRPRSTFCKNWNRYISGGKCLQGGMWAHSQWFARCGATTITWELRSVESRLHVRFTRSETQELCPSYLCIYTLQEILIHIKFWESHTACGEPSFTMHTVIPSGPKYSLFQSILTIAHNLSQDLYIYYHTSRVVLQTNWLPFKDRETHAYSD